MDTDSSFPGFPTSFSSSDEFVLKRALNRLQKQAPAPLPLKSMALILEERLKKGEMNFNASFSNGKAPIPLLTPLLLSPSSIDNRNTS
ncbi:hypothetical protein AMTR_s00047p00144880 [Amborella trichopoda]|uniref:Uncharacterized protein n=1 Tax=Amborella trichopoda TaxID=13333 RepID=U5DBJ6_AMBTC|nr:hypothetical protein AMTR_s00047p00144880 [Amborella trichopoda]